MYSLFFCSASKVKNFAGNLIAFLLTFYVTHKCPAEHLRVRGAIYSTICENPLLLWNNPKLYLLGKAFMVMYHSDAFDSEEQNVALAHLSMAYLQRSEELYKTDESNNDSDVFFEILRVQAVLLKTCEDCFIDSVSIFYQQHSQTVSDEEKKGSLLLAQRVMIYVLYSVLVEMTDAFDGFKGDAFLDEVCKTIELENPSISQKLVKEGSNIRKLLYAYSKSKIMNGNLVF